MATIELDHGDPLMIDYTPSGAAVTAGSVVLFAGKACIALHDIADGVKGALAYPNGSAVYRVNGDLTYTATEDSFALGGTLYVENGGNFSDIATSNTAVGTTIELKNTDEVSKFVHE